MQMNVNGSQLELGAPHISLFVTTLLYFAMNGAQIFETAVFVPKWTAAAPDSFTLFRGPHAIDLKTFWIASHSIHEVSMIVALILCWKLEIRNALLLIFVLHFAVRAWTLGYFAPEIMSFQRIAESGEAGVNLAARVVRWKNLNLLRVAAFVLLSWAMIPVCYRALLKLGP